MPSDEKNAMKGAEVSEALAELLERKVEVEEVVDAGVTTQLVESGKKGEELVAFAKELFAGGAAKPPGSQFLKAVLDKVAPLDKACAWSGEDEYGLLLQGLLFQEGEEEVKALFVVQGIVHTMLNSPGEVPKGLLEAVFMALYKEDIVDADAFEAWKDDLEDQTPGKMDAIVATSGFIQFLAEQEDDDDDDDDDDEEDSDYE